MSKWTANFVNNPNNDYELMVEILYDDKDVAIITQERHGLVLKWYANDKDFIAPLDWLLDLMSKAKKDLILEKEK